MNYKTKSDEYKTVRLSWPKCLKYECPICGEGLKFKYANAGKKVHTLQGIINQIINFYKCINENCKRYKQSINPHPRFDYGERRYGSDVFRLVSKRFLEHKSSIESIYLELTKENHVDISDRTVERMCDDILNLKAFIIDENTKKLLKDDPNIILGMDGQDPGGDGKALWLFFDLIHNRVLHTCLVDQIDHSSLHLLIENVKKEYHLNVIGFVSDKQNLITKCCDKYYPKIPHQYCEFHFLKNTWNHAETLDSNIYLPIKKAINNLYIHKASSTRYVNFEGKGKLSVRKVFKEIDRDLQGMLKIRNKTFKQLRGVKVYEELTDYVNKMDEIRTQMDLDYRFTKIFSRTIDNLKEVLLNVQDRYEECLSLYDLFQNIRKLFGDAETSINYKKNGLEMLYNDIWDQKKKMDPETKLSDLRSFLPNKYKTYSEILGEWVRLWNSYKRGLFQYVKFPEIIKTNNKSEQAFGQEKQRIYKRTSKKIITHMVETRGEAYLRITHCTDEELQSDIVSEYSKSLMILLRKDQQERIHDRTKYWRRSSLLSHGYLSAIQHFYPNSSEDDIKFHYDAENQKKNW